METMNILNCISHKSLGKAFKRRPYFALNYTVAAQHINYSYDSTRLMCYLSCAIYVLL